MNAASLQDCRYPLDVVKTRVSVAAEHNERITDNGG